jgi:hypothetical protein
MQEASAPADAPPRSSAIGGWALIVGAGCFGLFWTVAPTSLDDSFPWVPGLAVHAISILALATGLGLRARDLLRSSRPQPLAALGAVLAVLGTFAVFPLFPIGLGLVAICLLRTGYPRHAVALLAVGSAALLAVYVVQYVGSDSRIFGDGSPPFPLGIKLVFQASVILVTVGLARIGFQRGRSQDRSNSPG